MGSVEELGEHDRVQEDFRGNDLEESLDQPRVVLPQVGDPGIRVQEVNHQFPAGKPLATAHPAALDGDAILAAQTILAAEAGDVASIATNNTRHLSRFPGIDARHWSSITS